MTIGKRIRDRRKELGLTQEELAKRLGNSSRASVCTVENDREDLTTTRISKFASALGVTPAYLMGWKENTDYLASIDDTEVIIDMEKPHKNVKTALDLYEKFSAADKKTQDAIKALLEME